MWFLVTWSFISFIQFTWVKRGDKNVCVLSFYSIQLFRDRSWWRRFFKNQDDFQIRCFGEGHWLVRCGRFKIRVQLGLTSEPSLSTIWNVIQWGRMLTLRSQSTFLPFSQLLWHSWFGIIVWGEIMFWREVYCSIGNLRFELGDVNSSSVIYIYLFFHWRAPWLWSSAFLDLRLPPLSNKRYEGRSSLKSILVYFCWYTLLKTLYFSY